MSKIIALLLVGSVALADGHKCDNALKACEAVIEAQDQAIVNLKKSNMVLRQELDKEKNATPRWVIFLGGMAAGVIASSLLKK